MSDPASIHPVKMILLAAALVSAASAGATAQRQDRQQKASYYHRTFQKVRLSKDRVPQLLNRPLAYTIYAKHPTTAADVLAMSDPKIRSLITAKAAFEACRCPNCGDPEIQRTEISQLSDWSLDDPLRIQCKECGEWFPSRTYPENASIEVKTPTGKMQVYAYHKDKHGRMYFLTDTARFRLNETLVAACRNFAELWLITKEPQYARKAIVILDQFCEVWPDIPVHGFVGNDGFHVQFISSPPYLAYQVGKLSGIRKRALDLELVKAYDLLYESDEFRTLSNRCGYDVRARIEETFRRAIRMELLELGAPIPDWMLRAACCLHDAPLMHWAVRNLFGSMCGSGTPYCLDGQDPRGTGYHRPCGGYISAISKFVEGYSDPPGYLDLVDGTRFDKLDITGQNAKLWDYLSQKTAEAKPKFRYPNGYVAPIHNAWSTSKRGGPALEESRSRLFPGFGHAILGRGKGKDQVQAHLHFSCLSAHGDADMLNIILFAKGHEFLPDFGYCHQLLRAWSSSTLGHNTVVIDEQDQDFRRGTHNFGNLLFYDVSHPQILIADAEGKRAYRTSLHNVVPDLEVYRRRLLLVPVSEEDAYVVDLFHVKGGQQHDWVFHTACGPDGNEPQEITVALDLKPREGTLKGAQSKFEDVKLWLDEVHEGRDSEYGLVDNLRTATTSKTWTATIRFKRDLEAGLKLTMLGGPEREIIVGSAPNPRATNKNPKSWRTAKTQILLARERTREGLYAAVWEPYRESPFIKDARMLRLEGCESLADIGLRIELENGRVDYVLISDGRHVAKADGIEFQGQYGLVTEENGRVMSMYLGGGGRIAKGGRRLLGYDVTGEIVDVKSFANGDTQNCLVLMLKNPADTPRLTTERLKGRSIRVTHPDQSTHFYTIEKVEKKDNHVIVYTAEDPGFRMSYRNVAVNEPTLPLLVTTFLYYPRRSIEGGRNGFTIFSSRVWTSDGSEKRRLER